MRFSVVLHVAVAMTLVSTASGHAQKKYDPGASDTEIKLGQTLPYSGPVSVLSGVGKGETAYFKYLNESQSGINGRSQTHRSSTHDDQRLVLRGLCQQIGH